VSNIIARPNLLIPTLAGAAISVNDLRGQIIVLAFINEATCHTGQTLELIDGIMLQVGPRLLRSIGCIVDLYDGERPRDNFSAFTCDVGWASRRQVAEFLKVSMSGFHLPQLLVIDASGRHRLRCIPHGVDYEEAVVNLRESIEHIVEEQRRALASAERRPEMVETR
jgi:hypothetical protein